jgi:hypothetical protein
MKNMIHRKDAFARMGILLVLVMGANLWWFSTEGTVWALTSTDLVKINEVYYAGSMGFTMEDQYVELYNVGTTTAYLDGALLMRGLDTAATRVFRFPGWPGQHNYPIAPGQFKVIAQDAMNFMVGDQWSPPDPYSVDLSHADFETYTSWEWPPRNNPNVPNLTDALGNHVDFELDHYRGQVLLATGEHLQIYPCVSG